MDNKESKWLQKKIGVISSSEVDKLMSKSGKWIDGNKTYLYKIERQRYLNQPPPPISSRAMQIGIESEPYAIEWLRANTSMEIRHCDKDYDEKVFAVTDYGLGSSPDAFEVEVNETTQEEIKVGLIEIKTVVGDEPTNYYFSPTVPFDKKRLRAFDEHSGQMAGQLLVFPEIDKIKLMKYDPQMDDNEYDIRPVLDPTRGVVFEFTRAEFGSYLDDLKERVVFANNYLKAGKDIGSIQAEWDIFLTLKSIKE